MTISLQFTDKELNTIWRALQAVVIYDTKTPMTKEEILRFSEHIAVIGNITKKNEKKQKKNHE